MTTRAKRAGFVVTLESHGGQPDAEPIMNVPTRLGVVLVAAALVVAAVPSVALAFSVEGPVFQIGPGDEPPDPPRPGPGSGPRADIDATTTDAGGNRSTAGNGTTRAAGNRSTPSPENASGPSVAPSITFRNHTSGGESVLVDSVTLPDGGFVTVSVVRDGSREVVGVTSYLDAGEHGGTIGLGWVPGADRNLTQLGANATVVVGLHRDTDGDERFDNRTDPGTDRAYRENGTPVTERARVIVPPDRRPATAGVTIENQTTDGTSVEVASATLPDGGFVALVRTNGSTRSRDAGVLGPDDGFLGVPDGSSELNGSVLAATPYLGPGAYADLTLAVGAGVPGDGERRLNGSTVLTAVVYNDTNANGRFDPGPDGGDRPARTDGGVVADSALIRVERTGVDRGTTTTGRTETTTVETTTTAVATTTATATTATATTTATTTAATMATTAPTATTETDTRTGTPTPHDTTDSPASPTQPGTTTGGVSTTERSLGPGVIAGTDAEPDGATGNGVGGATPYGGTDDDRRDREAILNNPLLSVFGVVLVVFVTLVAIDWRRTGEE